MIRKFDTGATRDTELGKLDYEGFLSPLVIERFARYMDKHRHQSDGQLRDSDNWQKGIPKTAYMKSGWRHFFDWWTEHRGNKSREGIEDALCGVIFNAQGYLLEVLKEQINEEGQKDGLPDSESGRKVQGKATRKGARSWRERLGIR